jgi:hypothetical protein
MNPILGDILAQHDFTRLPAFFSTLLHPLSGGDGAPHFYPFYNTICRRNNIKIQMIK